MATEPKASTRTTTDAPAAPAAPKVDTELALEIPEGFVETLDEPTEVEAVIVTPEGDRTPPAESAKTELTTAETKPSELPAEPPKGDLKKALKEERGKRREATAREKFWQGKAIEIKRASDRALETLNLRGRVAPRLTGKIAPRIEEKDIVGLVKEADGADRMGIPVERVLRLINQGFEALERNLAPVFVEVETNLDRTFREREVQRMEKAQRKLHGDFDSVLRRAGIYDAVSTDPQTGRWRDERIGQAIYIEGEDNPAEAAYFLAKAILGEPIEDESVSVTREAVDLTPPATAEPATAVAASATKTPAEVEAERLEAERRGARTVIERVVDNTNRVKGIRGLRSSGGEAPRVVLNDDLRHDLDVMMEREPDKYLALMRKNPSLDKWHMGR